MENMNVSNEDLCPADDMRSCTDIRAFAQEVCQAVSQKLGGGFQVKLQEVLKNNGVMLQGLALLKEGSNISPTIYLNSLMEAYENHMPMEDIVDRILDVYQRNMPSEDICIDCFRDFEYAKTRICARVINRSRNSALLERIPHRDFLDLCICYYFAYEDAKLGCGSILIYNNHMEMWKCTEEDLFETAYQNTRELFPVEIANMGELLPKIGFDGEGLPEIIPMYVISNQKRTYGAISILYPEVTAQLEELLDEDYYIIPSSVHEVIAIPVSFAAAPKNVIKMIESVNQTHVAKEEVLSDCLYVHEMGSEGVRVVVF